MNCDHNLHKIAIFIKEIIYGDEFMKFRKTMREEGTVEACNRCGWLQPSI